MAEIDKEFPKSMPFGVLKTIQWVAPLAFLITLYAGTYIYSGIGFGLFFGWNAMLYSLITWICYLFGIHRRTFQVGQGMVFIPFALMDFLMGVLFFITFGITTLICIICIFNSINYRLGVLLTYLFATAFSMMATAAYGYYALLLYRSCPNGQLRNLSTLIVEGTEITPKPDFETTQRPTA